jgi:epoxyqueuosine reductase
MKNRSFAATIVGNRRAFRRIAAMRPSSGPPSPDHAIFVLVEPQFGGNVGASARALKNLGFGRMRLVRPACDPGGEEARRMAVDAEDVLAAAEVYDDLDRALGRAATVVGLTRRAGKHRHPHYRIDAVADELATLAESAEIAFLFGREDHGLSDADLDRATHLVRLPASDAYPSFNADDASPAAHVGKGPADGRGGADPARRGPPGAVARRKEPAPVSAASVELARAVRERALGAGFDVVGIARAEALDPDRARLEDWLARGSHAGMRWMARDPALRGDPRRLLPGCRSVIVCAMSYWPGEEAAATPPGRARVALYARGRDYHRVLGARLRELASWLERETGEAARAFTDTGPVLERAWAVRAGIGWIGKNANVMRRDLGSWLLLGEVLAAAELDPDPAVDEEFCGSCTACLDACPTGAIREPGVVDANACISYWTIEHRGPVPVERRSGNGDWIFGCDVCQDVCPWNAGWARPSRGEALARRDDLAGLDPADVLGLDEATFRRRYSGTSLMRAKWEGMRRNACIVLGNRGSEDGLAPLALALDDPDPDLRALAAWAVGRIGGARAREVAARALARETEGRVAAELRAAIAPIDGDRRTGL